MDLGKTISKIRGEKKISQKDLAVKCGISSTYLSLIETNKREPNLSTLKSIGENLEIPLPVIFFLSLNEEDIPQKKQEAYKLIYPSLKSFIDEFFIKLS